MVVINDGSAGCVGASRIGEHWVSVLTPARDAPVVSVTVTDFSGAPKSPRNPMTLMITCCPITASPVKSNRCTPLAWRTELVRTNLCTVAVCTFCASARIR